MSPKTVLITGVNGFVGSHVAYALRDTCRLVGLGTTFEDQVGCLDDYRAMRLPHEELAAFLRRINPDVVVHCAGSASVPFSVKNPEADFASGPVLVMHVLDAMRRAGVDATFIFPSSAAVYGNPENLPVTEDSAVRPISPYGHHKAMSEKIIEEYHLLYGFDFVIMRIFSCFGAGLRKQLLWDVANKISKGSVELFGTGSETRDFIHAFDLARVVGLLIEKDVKNLTLNVAGGRQISVSQIAGELVRAFDAAITPCFSGQVRAGDPLYWEADVSILNSLGFRPMVPLREGIAKFVEWYREERFSDQGIQDATHCVASGYATFAKRGLSG